MPELPEVEVVRRGLSRHVRGRTIGEVGVHHPRAVRRHVPGPDDLAARLRGRTVVDVRRRGKYLWLDLLPADGSSTVPDEALVMHLGMSGQLLVQPGSAAAETHLRLALSFADGDPQLRFVDQRTFGGVALEPLVPVVDRLDRLTQGGAGHARAGQARARRAGESTTAADSGVRLPGAGEPGAGKPGAGEPGPDVPETVPASVAHIARDPLDPRYDVDDTVERLRRKRTGVKRALLDQTLVSGIGNIYADEALWRARLHGERPSDRLTRQQAREVLVAAAEVMREALRQGGTSFDALYVNVNGESGYFSRHLAAYGRAGEPCDRCGAPIVRQSFMNRSSFSCPYCQPPPRARRVRRG